MIKYILSISSSNIILMTFSQFRNQLSATFARTHLPAFVRECIHNFSAFEEIVFECTKRASSFEQFRSAVCRFRVVFFVCVCV